MYAYIYVKKWVRKRVWDERDKTNPESKYLLLNGEKSKERTSSNKNNNYYYYIIFIVII